MQIDHNTMFTVKLNAGQWELILKTLGKLPYETIAPIIQTIIPQMNTELHRVHNTTAKEQEEKYSNSQNTNLPIGQETE